MSHAAICDCRFCRKLTQHVMTTDNWVSLHHPHGTPVTQPVPSSHPYLKWEQLRCPCGSIHIMAPEP